MTSFRPVLAVLLLAGLLLGGTADAKKKRTFCQKAMRAEKGKLVKKTHGVTVFRVSRTYSVCSDAKRFVAAYWSADPGEKATKIAAANKRCVAILFTSAKGLPEILFKDMGDKSPGAPAQIVGFGNPAATVGSLAVSRNCAAAWGESVTDAAGNTVYAVKVKGFGPGTSLTTAVTNVATVKTADDIAHVGIKAASKGVTVSWTDAGAKQSKTLP
jgi:hypothetical protein